MTRRAIVVGLDGASWDALDPLMERGVLPNLARLVREGVRAPLRSTYPGWTPPGWTSISTGLNPGGHGILYATRMVEGGYPGATPGGSPGAPVSSVDVHGAPLWRVLSAAGRRVCVLLVPLTYPVEPVNGVLVAGMFRPREATDYVHPPEPTPPEAWRFDPEVVLKGGDARHDDPLEVARGLREITEENARAFSDLLGREPWDLFFAVFMAPDRLGHYFWERLPRLDPASSDPVDREILGAFRAMDGFVGAALGHRRDGAVVTIVSDHGSGPAPLERANVIRALEEAGLLAVVRSGLRRKPVRPVRLDWARTQVFPVFSGDLYVLGLAANVRGRWPRGTVEPDAAGGALERAREVLSALRDPQGRPVVRAWHRGADVYRGPFADRFPDLVAELDPRFMAAGRPGGAWFEPHRTPETEWGSHRQEGVLAMSGPGVRAGVSLVEVPSVEDVAPTLMRLLGLSFTDPVDGRVLDEALAEAIAVTPAPAVPADRDPAAAPAVGAQEEAEIEGMLRGLGYLE